MRKTTRDFASNLALLGIVGFTLGEVAVWVLRGSSGTAWTVATVALRLLEFAVPLALLLSLPGLRRAAAIPGLAIKCWLVSVALGVSSLREMLGDRLVCLNFQNDALSSCMFMLTIVVAGLFWTMTCLELYAYRSALRAVDGAMPSG